MCVCVCVGVLSCADPEGGGGVENHKLYGFL